MSPRTLAIWTALAAGLLALYVIGGRLPSTPPPAAWISVSPDNISLISVADPGGKSVRLRRELIGWSVARDTGEIPADTGVVSQFLEMLGGLTSIYVVTDSPGKYSLFDLEETAAVRISLNDTSGIALFAGKRAPDGLLTYMRQSGNPSVRAVRDFNPFTVRQLLESGR